MRALLYLVFVLPLAGANWLHVRADDLHLYTDAGESNARAALARLAQLRSLFSEAKNNDTWETRIFLFASRRDFSAYADRPTVDGFYRQGPGYEMIVIHSGPEAARVLTHEYVHLLLHHGSPPLPAWLEEGLAEFYSTLELRGKSAIIGTPIPSHRAVLSRERSLSPDALTTASATHPANSGIFYAQSWALVHMLNLAPAYRNGMPSYIQALAAGEDTARAFSQAFGRTMEQALRDLPAYIPRMDSTTVEGAPTSQAVLASVAPIPDPDATALRAELALRTDHPDVARKLLTQAARANAGSPAMESSLGMLAAFEGDRAETRRHLERAIALGSQDPALWFEYALFERESGATSDRVTELLEKTIALNPNFADARFMLGVRLTDAGNLEAAVAHLQEAVRASPRRSTFWHALAFALEKRGLHAESLTAARQALRTAATSEEEAMAKALVESR